MVAMLTQTLGAKSHVQLLYSIFGIVQYFISNLLTTWDWKYICLQTQTKGEATLDEALEQPVTARKMGEVVQSTFNVLGSAIQYPLGKSDAHFYQKFTFFAGPALSQNMKLVD